MKRFILSLLAFAGLTASLSSCEEWEFLEEHPKKIDATTFMSNAEEVQSVINSIYYQLRRQVCFGRYLPVLGESLADYCQGRGNYESTFSGGLVTGGINLTKDTWAALYRAIRFSNEILTQIGGASLSRLEYDQLSGETRYLRAFCYSYLARYYGGVPFFDEHNMDDFNKPRTPEKEIWEFVAQEAAAASDLLPESVVTAGRPSRYAALMLLTEASLWLERWSDAAEAAGQIVTSGRYALVEVSRATDFDDLYSQKANATKEEIFYFKYNRDDGNSVMWMFLCKPNPIADTGSVGIYTDYMANKFIAGWDPGDLRYQYSLYKQTENGTLNSRTKTGMICFKFRDYETSGAASDSACDIPVYRYADALLYYAEALCRRDGGPSAAAMDAVNQVRRRAYGLKPTQAAGSDYKLADYNDTEKFLELVLRERGYETVFEGKRYTDLKRCGKLAEYAVKAGRIASESEVGPAAYWWPIPSDEFNYNTALDPTKDQNPGY